MRRDLKKLEKSSNLWILALSGMAFFLFILWFFASSEEELYAEKARREAKKFKTFQKILKAKGHLLISSSKTSKSSGKNDKKGKKGNMATLVEKVVEEEKLERWMIKIDPSQAGKGRVRITFKGLPFQGLVNFLKAFRKPGRDWIEEKNVSLSLMGRKKDQWQVSIVLTRVEGEKS